MHIVSWNINGILTSQYAIRKYLEIKNPDVLCLNELKVTPLSLEKVSSYIMNGQIGTMYDAVWNPCKKGPYHGTAIIAKKKLCMEVIGTTLPVTHYAGSKKWMHSCSIFPADNHNANLRCYRSHIPRDRDFITVEERDKAHGEEGRICTVKLYPHKESKSCDDYIILVSTYVPNSGINFKDPLRRLYYRTNHWDPDLFDYLEQLSNKYDGNVIWCGDLNVIHKENDVYMFKRRKGVAGVTNDERASFDGFLTKSMFVDVWRSMHTDVTKYSFYNAVYPKAGTVLDGWRLDYFVVHKNILDRIVSCTIDTEDDHDFAALVGGCGTKKKMRVSDHLPISIVYK